MVANWGKSQQIGAEINRFMLAKKVPLGRARPLDDPRRGRFVNNSINSAYLWSRAAVGHQNPYYASSFGSCKE